MIKIFPSPVLLEVAKKVENFGTPELVGLIASMFTIMAANNGAGLAAPQIGVSKRVFVYGFDKNPRYPAEPPVPKNYAINPTILWRSTETITLEEGCLSFPGLRLMVTRPKAIIFRTFDMSGFSEEKKAEGFLARIIQHETDHLDGRLFTEAADNPPDLSKLKY